MFFIKAGSQVKNDIETQIKADSTSFSSQYLLTNTTRSKSKYELACLRLAVSHTRNRLEGNLSHRRLMEKKRLNLFAKKHLHLLEAEVDGIGKGVVLQGDEPEEGLLDDRQEVGVDEGGDREGKEKFKGSFGSSKHVV